MVEPQEPSSLDPGAPTDRPPEDSPPASELDELRKNLSTQELNEKRTTERPGLIKRVTRPLTGALNRLRGGSRTGSLKKSDSEELEAAHFDHVLPPIEGLPPGDTFKALPARAGGTDAGDEDTYEADSPGAGAYLPALPFDSSMDALDEIDAEDALSLPAGEWPFDDSLTRPAGDPGEAPSPALEGDDNGPLDGSGVRLEEPPTVEKPRGWRARVTDFLGRTKPLGDSDQPSEFDVDDSVLEGRLGLSGVEAPAEEIPPRADLPGTEELRWEQPATEGPWFEGRSEFLFEESETLEAAGIPAPPEDETGPLSWSPDDSDWLMTLQSEQESLLAESEDDEVTSYWGPIAGGELEEPAPVEAVIESPPGMAGELSMDGMRGLALEEYEGETAEEPGVLVEKRGWLGFSRVQVALLAALAAVLVMTVALAAALLARQMTAAPARVEPTAVLTEVVAAPSGPRPSGVELTGGWFIPLAPSTIVEGKWQPQRAEWLTGSEIRRVVALPWNRQLEAVVQTLVPGDPIQLSFDNDVTLPYQVEKVERLTASSTSRIEDLYPSLLIVLAQENSTDRWLVTCTPVEVSVSP